MSQVVEATFEDGVFRPDTPLELAPQTRVRLVIEQRVSGVKEDAADANQQQQLSPTIYYPSAEERAAAWTSIRETWRTSKFCSSGERLTREQLHERR